MVGAGKMTKSLQLLRITGAGEGILLVGITIQIEGPAGVPFLGTLDLDLLAIDGGHGCFEPVSVNIFARQFSMKERLPVKQPRVIGYSHGIEKSG